MAVDVSRASFDAFPFPPQVVTTIANLIVGGSPFANALTRFPTTSGSVVWPTASPSGEGWVAEGSAIPAVTLGDDSYVIAAKKLGGILTLSNEAINDAVFKIEAAIGNVIRDTMSADLENGLLYGAGATQPTGIVAVATAAASSTTLRAAVIGAWGELVGAGATSSAIVAFVNPSDAAEEMGRTTTDGVPIHADGAAMTVGPVAMIPVPKLHAGDILVVDTSAVFLVVREDFRVDVSTDYGFATDSAGLRVTGRFAIAAPAPLKSIRKALIAP